MKKGEKSESRFTFFEEARVEKEHEGTAERRSCQSPRDPHELHGGGAILTHPERLHTAKRAPIPLP